MPVKTSRTHLGRTARIILMISMAGVLISYLLSKIHNFGSSLIHPDWIVVLFVETVLATFLFSWHQLRLENGEIIIKWFPFFVTRIPLAELESASKTRVNAWKLGFGARLIGNGTLALLHKSGTAVMLKFKNNKRYLISLNVDQPTLDFLEAIGVPSKDDYSPAD